MHAGAIEKIGLTPDEICAIMKSEQAGGQFTTSDHGGEDNLASVIDALSGNGDLVDGRSHDV